MGPGKRALGDGQRKLHGAVPVHDADEHRARQRVAVRPVHGDAAAEWLGSVAGTPGFRAFLAWADGEPAGTGALFVGERIGWLGLAATVPEHRRKGAQGALLAARLRAAAAAGIGELTTETGERLAYRPSNSYRNLLRFGFEEQYVRANYLSRRGA